MRRRRERENGGGGIFPLSFSFVFAIFSAAGGGNVGTTVRLKDGAEKKKKGSLHRLN